MHFQVRKEIIFTLAWRLTLSEEFLNIMLGKNEQQGFMLLFNLFMLNGVETE